MSSIPIDPAVPRRLQPQFACRNSTVVAAEYQSAMARSLNHFAFHDWKMSARFGGDVLGAIDNKSWRWAGKFGPLAKSMVVRIPCAPAGTSSSTSNPRVQLALHDVSGSLLTTGLGYFGRAWGRNPVGSPNEWGLMTIAVDIQQWAGQRFRARLIASSEARPISMVAYETPLPAMTENGYARQSYSVGAPILDADRRELQDLAVSLYEDLSPPLFSLSSNEDSGANTPTRTTATYQNVLTIPLSGPAVHGFVADIRHSCRKTKTTIPALVECYAGMAAAGTGGVRVVDGAGNVYAEFAVTGSANWQTAIEAEIPADRRTYFIEHKGSGADAITTNAVSVFRYQP